MFDKVMVRTSARTAIKATREIKRLPRRAVENRAPRGLAEGQIRIEDWALAFLRERML